MVEVKAITVTKDFFEVSNKHKCPDCSGAMAEIDRVNENYFSFIWHECIRANCNGQWLEKKSSQRGGI
jgi:hypothetical protein